MSRWIQEHGGARRLSPLAILVVLALSATFAFAFWSNAAGGSANGSAGAGTMPAGLTPTVSMQQGSSTVKVEIPQVNFYGDQLGTVSNSGYQLTRYPAGGGSGVTPNAPCDDLVSGAGATLECIEPAVPSGDWVYTATPVMRTWTGAESADSNEITTDLIPPPAAPANFQATLQPGGDVGLGWDAVSGVDGYAVFRKLDTAPSFDYNNPLSGVSLVVGTSYVDTTAVEGTAYTYVVRAVIDDVGDWIESVDSNNDTVTPDATDPSSASVVGLPAWISGTGQTLTGAASDSGSGIASLAFEYSPNGSNWYPACTATAPATSCNTFNTTALVSGNSYQIRVTASDVAGNTTVSNTPHPTTTVDNTPPNAQRPKLPNTITPTSSSNLKVKVDNTTDAGVGLGTVEVEYSTSPSGPWSDYCTLSGSPLATFSCTHPVATYITSALTHYYFRVVATDLLGNTSTSTNSTTYKSTVDIFSGLNPGFEATDLFSTSNWNCHVRYLGPGDPGYDPLSPKNIDCDLDVDIGNAHSGDNNSYVHGTGGGQWGDVYRSINPANLIPNQWYCESVWVRTSSNVGTDISRPDAKGYFGLRKNGEISGLATEGSFTALTGNYVQLFQKVQTGADVTNLEFFAGIWTANSNSNSTWAQFDDFGLYPISGASSTCGVQPPTSLLAVLSGGGPNIDLDWTAPSPAPAGYNVYRRTDPGSFNFDTPLNGDTPLTGTSFTDTTALPATDYYYVVRSVVLDDNGADVESGNSNEATFDDDPPNVAVTGPSNGWIGSTFSVTASTVDVGTSGIDPGSVVMEISPQGAGTWTALTCAPLTQGVDSFTCAGNSASGLGLTHGNYYDLRATASDMAGNSATSAIVTVRLDSVGPTIGTLSGVPAVHVHPATSISITGATGSDALSGLDFVEVQVKANADTTWSTGCTADGLGACTINTTAWLNGTTYNLRIHAQDEAGTSTYGSTVNTFISRNILTNPGFESSPASTSWTCTGTTCGWDVNLGNAHSGLNNAYVNGGAGVWMQHFKAVPTVNTQWYCMSIWTRNSGNFPPVLGGTFFGLRVGGGSPLGELRVGNQATYAQFGVKAQADRATGLEFFTGAWGESGGAWAQFDDVSMRPIPNGSSNCPGA